MGLHLSILRQASRGFKKRHGNARPQRRLRPVVPNAKAELTYKRALLTLVGRCRKLVDETLAREEHGWQAPASDGYTADGSSLDLLASLNKAKLSLGNLDTWAKKMAGIVAELNRDSVDKRLSRVIHESIGVDVSGILASNGKLLSSMKEHVAANVDLIKTIPQQYFDRVEKTVTEGWTQGLRWESLVEKIQEDGNITERRAKLIARDQTAKMNSDFNRERQQQVGIERYEWSTSVDERVRESHAEMEGKECRWDDPPIIDDEAVNPGEAVQCRCVAIPIVDMEALEIQALSAEQAMEEAA